MTHATRSTILITAAAIILNFNAAPAQTVHPETLPLRADGGVPAWLVAGPFEQATQGFGLFADIDAVAESLAAPNDGRSEVSRGVIGGSVAWVPRSTGSNGYLDLNSSVGWTPLATLPEQLWWTKAAYGFVTIVSPDDRDVKLLCGSNSQLRVFLNGSRLLAIDANRTAKPDQDTVRLRLTKGRNRLLVKIANSHQNHHFDFFGGNPWGWGGYFRLVDPQGKPANGLTTEIGIADNTPPGTVVSTFYFRQAGKTLLQRFDFVFRSTRPEPVSGLLSAEFAGKKETLPLPSIPFGENRISWYLVAPETNMPVRCTVDLGGTLATWTDTLRREPRYELHLVMQSHTDIGYTNPQPVVKEMHCTTLDSVVARCERDPEFRWNIETVWQLKLYEESRTQKAFNRLMQLVKEGRVALSPFFSNPFTGWVSEEEMIRSLYDAHDYARRYGFKPTAAVYNDVPGLTWFLPQLCTAAGVDFLVCGLNEVYGGYTLQKSIPKAFLWEGRDGSRLLTYRTELYAEGGAYGLDRDTVTISHCIWDRLSRLRASGYEYPLVLLNSVFLDNGGVAPQQIASAKAWNSQYAYPRFVFSTPPKFAQDFRRAAGSSLKTVRGDWTSTWDVLFQGEPSRVIRERWTQDQIGAAEKFSAISSLLTPGTEPLRKEIADSYHSLLMYSGHGSGLEYGYGTPSENAVTMDYREEYVRDAQLTTKDVLLRALTRLTSREVAFEREGVIVFNPLSWTRDIPLTLELKEEGASQYEVVEMASGKPLPSFREGYRLFFTATAVPPLGFKKFKVANLGAKSPDPGQDLALGPGYIANQHLRIAFEPGTGKIASVSYRKTGRELIDTSSTLGFNEPLRERPFGGEPTGRMPRPNVAVRVIDQRPARVTLEIRREGDIFERSTVSLRPGSVRIEFVPGVNLEKLTPPASVESYGVAFPLLSGPVRCEAEILGGYFDPDKDRFPGVTHEGFCLRKAAALSNGTTTAMMASPDSRVFFWKPEPGGKRKTLVANLVNNFPRAWNRNEENRGTMEYRFMISATDGPFDPERTSRFGWESSSEQLATYTLLRSSPAESSFVSVEGRNVILATLKPAEQGEGIVLRLINVDSREPAECTLISPLFQGMSMIPCSPLEEKDSLNKRLVTKSTGPFKLYLKPNETATVLLQ